MFLSAFFTNYSMTLPTHITHFPSWGHITGPSILILGGTHGDERAAIEIIKRLIHRFQSRDLQRSICGSLYIGFGNPIAIAQRTRAASITGRDLNRCFTDDTLEQTIGMTEDIRRANELLPLLHDIDVLIDVHSTSMKSVPFLCCERAHDSLLHIAEYLPVDRILTDPHHILSGNHSEQHPTMDSYLNRRGAVGLCYETGEANDLTGVEHIAQSLFQLLTCLGVIETDCHMTKTKQTLFSLSHRIDAAEDRFMFKPGLVGWTQVQPGQRIGRYESGTYEIAPTHGFLLFPKAKQKRKKGTSLYFLAQPIDNNDSCLDDF